MIIKKILACLAILALLTYSYGAVSGSTGTGFFVLQNAPSIIANLYVGVSPTITADAPVLINRNVTASVSPQFVPNGTLLHLSNADTVNGADIVQDAFGTGVTPRIAQRIAAGTAGSLSAISSGAALFEYDGFGYDGSAYGQTVQFRALATENFSGTHHGTQLVFKTVANGTTTLKQNLIIDHDGQLYAPSLVNGTGATSGAACYTSSNGLLNYDNTNTCLVSSAAYKNNITLYQQTALGIITQLTPVTFQYNANLGMYPATRIGLIAEDVATVAPQLVANNSQGAPNKIFEFDLLTVAIKAIQEQQLQITALQNALKMANIPVVAVNPVPKLYTPPVVTPFVPPAPIPDIPSTKPGFKASFLGSLKALFGK